VRALPATRQTLDHFEHTVKITVFDLAHGANHGAIDVRCRWVDPWCIELHRDSIVSAGQRCIALHRNGAHCTLVFVRIEEVRVRFPSAPQDRVSVVPNAG